MKRLEVDLVDEHFYRSPEWFLRGAKRYDSYDRNGPKVFAGEYACHAVNRENSFLTALCEAAFMTGFERNADVVHLCTYAPLFAHADAWQWRPDLIWFDNLSLVKTPNYYVQQLYGHYAGTNVLPLKMNNEPVAGQHDLYATAALDKETNELIIKAANVSIRHKTLKLVINGLSPGKHDGRLIILHSSDLEAKNTLYSPDNVAPAESTIEVNGPIVNTSLKPLSFSVYRIAL
jgi:alpha-L-arabinofuranosidase